MQPHICPWPLLVRVENTRGLPDRVKKIRTPRKGQVLGREEDALDVVEHAREGELLAGHARPRVTHRARRLRIREDEANRVRDSTRVAHRVQNSGYAVFD